MHGRGRRPRDSRIHSGRLRQAHEASPRSNIRRPVGAKNQAQQGRGASFFSSPARKSGGINAKEAYRMTANVNRQWRLAARPVGLIKESDFKLTEEPAPTPGE